MTQFGFEPTTVSTAFQSLLIILIVTRDSKEEDEEEEEEEEEDHEKNGTNSSEWVTECIIVGLRDN